MKKTLAEVVAEDGPVERPTCRCGPCDLKARAKAHAVEVRPFASDLKVEDR